MTDIQLITPPEAASAIEAALAQDRHLTSLISHKVDVVAPKDLTQTTGTAEIFRLPEVKSAIKGDFLLLPCDLVCELDGVLLLKEWMVQHTGLACDLGSGLKGGLGVWYQTKGPENTKEETDFVITSAAPKPIVNAPKESISNHISKLVYSKPTDTLKDQLTSDKNLVLRQAMFRRHARVEVRTTYRDAHVYLFPSWILTMMQNEKFDSVSEDIIGWWSKGTWQKGLCRKLGLSDVMQRQELVISNDTINLKSSSFRYGKDDAIDIAALSSTSEGPFRKDGATSETSRKLATRVQNSFDTSLSSSDIASEAVLPPILAYIQPSESSAPLIQRVDNAHRLLSVSLRLAKLPAKNDMDHEIPSPFAHEVKVANADSVPKRCTVQGSDSLVAETVTIEEKVNIKESVIGSGCRIAEGARLLRCLLMEGAIVGPNCQLTGCILGRRCKLEGGNVKDSAKTNLKECEIQDEYVVPWGSK